MRRTGRPNRGPHSLRGQRLAVEREAAAVRRRLPQKLSRRGHAGLGGRLGAADALELAR